MSNRTATNTGPILGIIALIAVVNALGYGIIIPIIYSYTRRYGLTDFENGLLFSLFSLCQFASTPIIGRLSDKYGRKPLLAISLAGSAVSFLLMAVAPSALLLFVARALDGVTAGNIPVASAVISDVTDAKNRAKGFGILGAAFGFGFVFGPAISAFTVRWGEHIPFLISAAVAAVATVLTLVVLPETNRHERELSKSPVFDFGRLVRAVLDPQVGRTLSVSLVYSLAFSLYIFAFQPYAVKTLSMSPTAIATMFTGIGVVGLVAQGLVIPRAAKRIGDRRLLSGSLAFMVVSFLVLSTTRTVLAFTVMAVIHAFFNSFAMPMIQTILSRETDDVSQGSIMGLNASYQSIGTIIGPILGGAIATVSLTAPFVTAAVLVGGAFMLSSSIVRRTVTRISAFAGVR